MSKLVDVSSLSSAELEAMLKKKKEKEAKKLAKEKAAYEKERDTLISEMVDHALELSEQLTYFKELCHVAMDKQCEKLKTYGKIRSNSKGGFQVVNTEGTKKLVRRRDTTPVWDERSEKAMQLIKAFLMESVKKRDKKQFTLLMSFLERNKNGDLEYSRVMNLIQNEELFDDERWVEGLRLMKESFSNHLKGFGYEFKIVNDEGKWVSIPMNFSAM